MYLAPRGTFDILPEDQPYWQYLYEQIQRVVTLFDYQRIDIPVFEETSLYVRGVGEGTDIVDKEMYSFVDKGDRDITLRPEFTAGIVRAYIQHGMKTLPQPVKLYTVGPLFRYERVQAGRYRQHTQFDIECIGSLDPAVDLEVMSLAWYLYSELGFQDLSFQLNSTGCPECRPAYIERLVSYYESRRSAICEDCERRLARNPLRLLDCKVDSCQPVIADAPHMIDYLCPECAEHLATLRSYLEMLERPYTLNHRLVRGLDYYGRTVFEWVTDRLGAQGTVCAGGRYDGLVEQLGGRHTPAAGFAMGIERLLSLLEADGGLPLAPVPHAYLMLAGAGTGSAGVELSEQLRDQVPGLRLQVNCGGGGFKAQMRRADRSGARLALILGETELAEGQVTVKPLREGQTEQHTVAMGELAHHLARILDLTTAEPRTMEND